MGFALPLAVALAFAPAGEPAAAALDAGTAAAADERKPSDKVRAAVHLRDGGQVRGTVRRMKLGKSITLRLASGKSITVDDADVVSIELFGSAAPADAGTPEAGAASPDAFAEQTVRPTARGQAAVSDLDTVYLADGGLLRGTIESEKPDLVLRLVSGRKRTLAAKEVKSVVRRGAVPAAADAGDAVWLKDGTVVRGAVESEKPDVVVRLVSGRRRTIPAASVQRIDRGKKP